jgi:hypothetical protein
MHVCMYNILYIHMYGVSKIIENQEILYGLASICSQSLSRSQSLTVQVPEESNLTSLPEYRSPRNTEILTFPGILYDLIRALFMISLGKGQRRKTRGKNHEVRRKRKRKKEERERVVKEGSESSVVWPGAG